MLPKHNKDVIFIVIILVLLAIILGVPRDIGMLIAANILIIMVGIVYAKLNEIEKLARSSRIDAVEGETLKDDTYKALYNLAAKEKDEFLDEADYDSFEDIKVGKELIKKFIDTDEKPEEILKEIRNKCKFKLQIYFLGLSAILMANTDKPEQNDFKYIVIGVELIKSSEMTKNTGVMNFIKRTKLKIKT